MNPAEKAIRFVDRFQQRLPGLSFVVGVWKKFSDDQAGNLAALIAYYAFVSLFPLLLILFTVLSIVLRDNQHLQDQVIGWALTDYPGFATLLTNSIKSFHETGVALVFGVILTVLGTRGVANAIQNALNSVWEVPRENRPRFPWSWLRSFGLILVVGVGEIATSVASGFVSTATVLPGFEAKALVTVVTLAFNIGVFWLAFRMATASSITWRELWLGAILGGIVIGGLKVGQFLLNSADQNQPCSVPPGTVGASCRHAVDLPFGVERRRWAHTTTRNGTHLLRHLHVGDDRYPQGGADFPAGLYRRGRSLRRRRGTHRGRPGPLRFARAL